MFPFFPKGWPKETNNTLKYQIETKIFIDLIDSVIDDDKPI